MEVDSVDPDRVVLSINHKFRSLQPLPSGCCIYRVPEILRKVNEDAYRPSIVSFGPFHHNDERLKPMQEYKVRYLETLVKRNKDKNIDDYVQLVRERQQDIRNCYNQQIELDDDTFVEMVLLDAAFIIEILSHYFNRKITEVVSIDNTKYLSQVVFRDMMLEENQLPFFVLNDIYNLANPGHIGTRFSFFRLANEFAYMAKSGEQTSQYIAINAEINHFVDLLRRLYLPFTHEIKSDVNEDDYSMTGDEDEYNTTGDKDDYNVTGDEDDNNMTSLVSFGSVIEIQEAGVEFKVSIGEDDYNMTGIVCIPSVTELQEAGVKFNVSTMEDDYNKASIDSIPSVTELQEVGVKFKVSTSQKLLDISFNNGVLQIPKLKVIDQSETLFRNLVAFEQLHPSAKYYISDYLGFLDTLINTTEDVDILVKNGIIYNGLGSNEEAAKVINSLCTNICLDYQNFYYSEVCEALNKYMANKWNRWRAILKSRYFGHPWAVISVIYAIVLLILTLLQVITGFIQIS